jgi:hypothetical protein
MRKTLLVAVLGIAAACGGGGEGDDAVGDDAVGDDAVGDDSAGDDTIDPPDEGFQLVSPDITLAPGEETTKCWYFQTPNTADLGVRRWESVMTPGSHHMIVYFSDEMQEEPGTITEDCGITGGGGGLGAVWTYSAQDPEADQMLPEGVGMPVKAGQYGFIQMHYLNASDTAVDVHVTLNVDTYAEGTEYIHAAPYITFHYTLDIPPMSTGVTFGGSCNVPADRNFYQLGTHAHKQAVHMEVRDGESMVFETDDWSHPGGREWLSAPFHQFTSGTLNYQCVYDNPNNYSIETGDSAQTDEMCMAVGYMFPATRPTICVTVGDQSYYF